MCSEAYARAVPRKNAEKTINYIPEGGYGRQNLPGAGGKRHPYGVRRTLRPTNFSARGFQPTSTARPNHDCLPSNRLFLECGHELAFEGALKLSEVRKSYGCSDGLSPAALGTGLLTAASIGTDGAKKLPPLRGGAGCGSTFGLIDERFDGAGGAALRSPDKLARANIVTIVNDCCAG